LLHSGAYLAGIGGVIHFWMMVKADLTSPIIHATILGLLLAFRLIKKQKKASPQARNSRKVQLG
jgi:sulfoxide reductase heme-binding subunit YedZ